VRPAASEPAPRAKATAELPFGVELK